jgi:hypothetical protein
MLSCITSGSASVLHKLARITTTAIVLQIATAAAPPGSANCAATTADRQAHTMTAGEPKTAKAERQGLVHLAPVTEATKCSVDGRKQQSKRLQTGKRRPLPVVRLRTILRQIVDIVEHSYQHIYGFNLGVQSGTAVIEDVMLQRVHALCCRVQAMISQDEACAHALVAFHKQLEPFCGNRMHVIWDAFGMQHVSDFLRLHLTGNSDVFKAAMESHRPALQQHDEGCRRIRCKGDLSMETAGEWTMRSAQFTKGPEQLGPAMVDNASGAATNIGSRQSMRHLGVKTSNKKAEPMRYQQLRESGHPFITIVDNMIVVSFLRLCVPCLCHPDVEVFVWHSVFKQSSKLLNFMTLV